MTDPLYDLLLRVARRVLGEDWDLARISPEKTFDELGIDSLFLTEIAYGMLKELDLYVPMARLVEARTVSGLLELLREETAGG
jgi:acyl carrier protein